MSHGLVSLVVAAAGLVGGLLNAAGAGGGVLVVLALLAVGMPTQVAIATMQVSIPAGFLGAVLALLASGGGRGVAEALGVRREVRSILPGVIAAMAGTAVGVLLVSQLSGPAVRAAAPGLMVVAGVLLAVQPQLPRVLAMRGTRVTAGAGRRVDDVDTSRPARPIALPVWLFVVSLYAGAWGSGAAVAVLLVLVVLTPWTWRQANTSKNGLCLAMSLIGAGVFLTTGLADLGAAAVLVGAQLLGGVLGARLADWLPENVLRGTVAATAVLGAVAMTASN